MSEQTPPADQTPASPATDDPAGTATPPTADTGKAPKWEGEFDPERAGALVAKLRAELADTKGKLSAREEAEMTESQKLQARAEKAEKELAEARTERLRDKVAQAHNLPAELAEFLTGDTEEALNAKAEALAKYAKTTAPASDLPGKPKAKLVPGHGDTDAPAFDPDAVARAARSRY